MSKNVWIVSAILVLVVGVFVGTTLSDSEMLNFMSSAEQTEQVEVSESPWTKVNNQLTTQISYDSPVDIEEHTLTIELDENNLVTSFEMDIQTDNDVSLAYQKKFIAEIEQMIIGKKASELAQIDTVAGASVTTNAFKQAFSHL